MVDEKENFKNYCSDKLDSDVLMQKKREIFKKRAEKQSQVIADEYKDVDVIEVLEFLLAEEVYAIETKYIREVYPLTNIRKIPGIPNFIIGVINIRRKILSIMDLKKIFDLPEQTNMQNPRGIILEIGENELVLLADSIIGVYSLALRTIQDALPTLIERRQDFLKGVTHEGVIILDAKKILSDQKNIVCDTV